MAQLLTEWSTDNTALAEALRLIDQLSDGDPRRYEAEAQMHLAQARFAWRKADQLRESQRERQARKRQRGAQ